MLRLREKDYVKDLLFDLSTDFQFEKPDFDCVLNAKESIEECCKAEYPAFFEKSIDDSDWTDISVSWVLSPMDKFYRLGQVFRVMFYIKLIRKDDKKREEYFTSAEKYLRHARVIGDALRSRGCGGRSTWHISEENAWLYILRGEYEKAIKLLSNARDSYIKNTYAIALMLTRDQQKCAEAENVLEKALSDQFNLDRSWSATLLCWLYELAGQDAKKKDLMAKHGNAMSKTYLRLLSSPEDDYKT